MSLSNSIPIGAGLAIGLSALALVAGAMFLTDQSEEALHLYRELRPSTPSPAPSIPSGGPMELQGKWQGLTLMGVTSARAQQLGLGEVESGVVVAGVDPGAASARAAGVQPGDVIVGVDNQPVKDLSDIYAASRTLNPLQPVLLDVRRQGQPTTLVLPAAATTAPQATGEQEGGGTLGGFALPGANPAQPAAWTGGQLYCPRDRLVLPQGSLKPPYLCPRCQQPMQPLPLTAR